MTACVAPVRLAVTVDNTCLLPKVGLSATTAGFLAMLYDADGTPRQLTIEIASSPKAIAAPPSLKTDLGRLRKNRLAYDIACKGRAKLAGGKGG